MATITAAARWSSPARLQFLTSRRLRFSASSAAPPTSAAVFGWADALRVAGDGGRGDESDISGYFRKVKTCNRGMDKKGQFVEFSVEDQVVGYIHMGFIEYLRDFHDVFTIVLDNNGSNTVEHVSLHSSLRTPEDRTHAIGSVIKSLGEMIPGIRNELYPVTSSYGMPVYFSLERAAAPYFGIKAYGVHMNGYVEKNGQKFLWIGKRSDVKQTYPGMLDHLVAGGLPYGISCKENIIKECEEEAGIARSISTNAASVGAVSYMDIEGFRYKRDVLFCYDLKLPADFVPNNEDGEVDSFRLIPVPHAANIIRRTEFFKPNCNLVIIDFLFRHGYINPDCRGYLGRDENALPSSWYEALLVLHLMAKGFLEYAIQHVLPRQCQKKHVLPRISPENRKGLPVDLSEGVLKAICMQALGQVCDPLWVNHCIAFTCCSHNSWHVSTGYYKNSFVKVHFCSHSDSTDLLQEKKPIRLLQW